MLFRSMPAPVRAAFDQEMTTATGTADDATRWRAIERAHILSQPWPWPHTHTHAVMLRFAWTERDWVEALGQLARLLVAAPASAFERYPEGNTGRARVPMTQPMPMPDDLAAIVEQAR